MILPSRSVRALVRAGAASVILGGAAGLAAWLFGIITSDADPRWFKANTGLCFIAMGAALLLLVGPPSRAWAGRLLAALVLVFAVATLSQDVTGVSLGIDQMLVDEIPAEGVGAPGRMSPFTAAGFVLLSAGLLARDARRAPWLMDVFVHSAGVLVLLSINGYLFQALRLTGASQATTGIAVSALALFAVLGAAILASRPGRGLARLVLAEGAGGRVARSLLPVALALPVVLGALALQGSRHGWFDEQFASALRVTLVSALLAIAVSRTALALHGLEISRNAARDALLESRRQLEVRVEERTRELALANEQLAAANASLRERSVARELAQRVVALGGRDLSSTAKRDLGRSLARELAPASLESSLAAYQEMGAGRIELVEARPGTWRFQADATLESEPDRSAPTCALALGYLEGATAALSGQPTLGTEMRCRSQGHARCEFVVAVRSAER